MNTQEKIDLAATPRQISLHKEGIFYKLYNQQALLFTQNIKPLKIKVKFVKTVNRQVYSCGFPVTIVEDVKKHPVVRTASVTVPLTIGWNPCCVTATGIFLGSRA
jgi:hypothetical protein